MLPKLITYITILHLALDVSFAQDTMKIESSKYYSSLEHPLKDKSFYFNVQLAREDIHLNDSQKRVEYCYYYDSTRSCFGTTYQLKDEKHLLFSNPLFRFDTNIIWQFRVVPQGFELSHEFLGTHQTAFVESLIPFEPEKIVTYLDSNKSKVLYTIDYSVIDRRRSHQFPLFAYPQEKPAGRIFDLDQVDIPAFRSDGDSIPTTMQFSKNMNSCVSQPLMFISSVSFIVTAGGEIINVMPENGNYDMAYCPYDLIPLINSIYQLGRMQPAIKNGKNVNVRYVLNVNGY